MVQRRRKRVRYHKPDRSKSINSLQDFLAACSFEEPKAESVSARDGTLLQSAPAELPFNDPAFSKFLYFLEQAAIRHSERLGNILDLTVEDTDLVDDVDLDD